MDEIVAMGGEISVRRAYGDFSKESNRAWRDTCQTLSIVPVQSFVSSSTTGKSFNDSAVTIDAMDLLHSNSSLDGFVLMLGESDFGRLAQRLREAGKHVVGVGLEMASPSFVQSCDRFIRSDKLLFPKPPVVVKDVPKANKSENTDPQTDTQSTLQVQTTEIQTDPKSQVKEPQSDQQPDWMQRVRGLWTQLPLLLESSSAATTPTSEAVDPSVPNSVVPANSNGSAAVDDKTNPSKTDLKQTLTSEEVLFFHEQLNRLFEDEDDDDDAGWVPLVRVEERMAHNSNSFFDLSQRGYAGYFEMFQNYPDEFQVVEMENSMQIVRSLQNLNDESDGSPDGGKSVSRLTDEDILFFREALDSLGDPDELGWVPLSSLNEYKNNERPEFHLGSRGYKKYTTMFQDYAQDFELLQLKSGICYVRIRPQE